MSEPMSRGADGTDLFGFDCSEFLKRIERAANQPGLDAAAADKQMIRDLKKHSRTELRSQVVGAVIDGEARLLRNLIAAGAPLDGTGPGLPGDQNGSLLDVALVHFSKDIADVLLPELEKIRRFEHEHGIRRALRCAYTNNDPRPALLWIQEKALGFEPPMFVRGYLLGLASLLEQKNQPTERPGRDRFLEDLLKTALARADDQKWSTQTFGAACRESALFSLWGSILTDDDGRSWAAKELTVNDFMSVCKTLLTHDGMRALHAPLMTGLTHLLGVRPELGVVFSDALLKGSTTYVSWPARVAYGKQFHRNALCSVAPEAGCRGSGASFTVKPLIWRLVLGSPLREALLADPVTRGDLLTTMLDQSGGRDILVAGVCSLEIDELMAMAREHRSTVAAWRDESGNTFAHYVMALRSGSRSVVDGMARIDPSLLSDGNNAGFSVVDLMDGDLKIYAERVSLKKEAGRAGAKPKRAF